MRWFLLTSVKDAVRGRTPGLHVRDVLWVNGVWSLARRKWEAAGRPENGTDRFWQEAVHEILKKATRVGPAARPRYPMDAWFAQPSKKLPEQGPNQFPQRPTLPKRYGNRNPGALQNPMQLTSPFTN
jgi:Protein of unknown function (DUF2934)